MTRPKVAPDQRQRTAQACESCKRRKQKCNGLCPCNTCEKRKFTCEYPDRDESSPAEQPAKKRGTHKTARLSAKALAPSPTHPATSPAQGLGSPFFQPKAALHRSTSSLTGKSAQPLSASLPLATDESVENAARSLQQFSTPRTAADDRNKSLLSAATSQSGHEEEAVVYSQTRMLLDSTGRLLYIGDSASLAFLQIIRLMVESVVGHCPFTDDPRRHKLMETQFTLPSSTRITHLLPDKQTASELVESFFVNTHGLVQIFDKKDFMIQLDVTYQDPLSVEPSWLCLLNLVFAIGLMMAAPQPSTPDPSLITKLLNEHEDRAEVFYLNAKSLNDPLTGFEDADFWSVQALLLMTIYMLAKSKRNTGFALLGMAVRSAYALGLHREETMVIFPPAEQAARRNLWRSLFVMDRFLALSLGRPPAISEDDCGGNALKLTTNGLCNGQYPTPPTFEQTALHGLDAVTRSCSVIGTILRRVYQQRKINTKLAQEIVDLCKECPKTVAPIFQWRQAAQATPSHGIAILHVNLFYCHSIILITRPFFLYVLNSEIQRGAMQSNRPRIRRSFPRMEKFTEACVIASTHTVALVQNAFEAGYLPQRNPIVMYFLFAAALVLLSNDFSQLYVNPGVELCIRQSITIMTYCAETDPQASRLLFIMSSFREVVIQQQEQRARQAEQISQLPPVQLKGQQHGNPFAPPMSLAPMGAENSILPQQPLPQHSLSPASHVYSTNHFPQTSTSSPGFAPPPQLSYPIPSSASVPMFHQTHRDSSSSTPTPLEPIPPPSVPHNPLSPRPSVVGTPQTLHSVLNRAPMQFDAYNTTMPFPSLLDLSVLGTDVVSVSEDSSGPDENIDFDALWNWTGGQGDTSMNMAGPVQSISDGVVPLFGVLES